MHYYFYFSKVQIRKNLLKYSNEVKILRYIPPLDIGYFSKNILKVIGAQPTHVLRLHCVTESPQTTGVTIGSATVLGPVAEGGPSSGSLKKWDNLIGQII